MQCDATRYGVVWRGVVSCGVQKELVSQNRAIIGRDM